MNHPVDLSLIRRNWANLAEYNLYNVFRTVFNFRISVSSGSKSIPSFSILSLIFSVISSSVISSFSEFSNSFPTSMATSFPMMNKKERSKGVNSLMLVIPLHDVIYIILEFFMKIKFIHSCWKKENIKQQCYIDFLSAHRQSQ